MEKSKKTSGGIGVFGFLTIIFIILKLCGVITWNWFWICFPMIFICGVIAFLLIILGTLCLITKKKRE